MTDEEQIEFLKEQVKLYRFDYLTGLKQRRDFDHDLRAKFKVKDFYLCMYDVTGLHLANREQGYAYGDRLLRQVAGDIQHQLMPHTTYRVGGDEFFTICCTAPTVGVDNATMVFLKTEDYDDLDILLRELDRQLTEKKILLKRRRLD